MKYLTVFRLDDFEAAEVFTAKTAAEKFIHDCAKAAKTKAFKNQENSTCILAVQDQSGKEQEITADIEPVDATVKYELSYDKNDQHVETSYYTSRKALVAKAKQILDELGFTAAPDENQAGEWVVNDTEHGTTACLRAKLVVMGSDENIISAYKCPDLNYFFKHITEQLATLKQKATILTAAQLKAARKRGFINLGVGIGIALAGGLFSFLSYQMAQPGERYTVYTGLIVIGIIDAICGLFYLINPKSALPKKNKKR